MQSEGAAAFIAIGIAILIITAVVSWSSASAGSRCSTPSG